MGKTFQVGDCVQIPDGRIGRVREIMGPHCKVRVRRTTSETHQLLKLIADDLKRVDCPKGWMSPEGYARYLDTTLAKMREREAAKKRRQSKRDRADNASAAALDGANEEDQVRQQTHMRGRRLHDHDCSASQNVRDHEGDVGTSSSPPQ